MQNTAALKGDELLISYSHPGDIDMRQLIYFDRTISNEVAAAMGRRRRDEDCYVDLVIDIFQSGDDPQGTEERCWELVGAIETLLRENPQMPSAGEPTGTVSGWVDFKGVEVTPYIQPSQRYVEAICKLHVKNRK